MTGRFMENAEMADYGRDIHVGHRQRMREKLKKHSERTLETYELLEMLLYHVLPQGDTHPIAKRLLFEFGSVDGVFRADKESLMRVDGPAAAEFILGVGGFIGCINDSAPCQRIKLDDFAATGEYVLKLLENAGENAVVMILLDSRLDLIDSSVIYNKVFASAGVKPDKFMNYAIERRASVAITAHTQKRYGLFPLVGDRESCKMITEALSGAGILHLEHYIVSGGRFAGSMDASRFVFNQTAEIERFVESRKRYNGK